MSGFWDKFLGQGSKEKEKKLGKIKFSQLKSWLEEKQSAKGKEVEKETQPLVDDILDLLEELRQVALEMKKKGIPPTVPKRARKVIQTSQPDFVKGILRITALEENLTLEKFQASLQESLDKLGKLLASKGRYLPMAFPEEMAALGKKANQLLHSAEELRKVSFKDKNLEGSLFLYNKIKQSRDELKNLAGSQKEIKNTLAGLTQKKEELEGKYKITGESNKMQEFYQEEKEEKEITQKKEKTELELYNFLSPLKRPLKKFRKYLYSQGRGSREIEGYLENPVDKFLNFSEKPFHELLREIKENSSKLELKPQDLQKVETALNKFDELKKLKVQYFQLEAWEKEIQEKLSTSTIVKETEELRNELESIQREIILGEKKLEKVNAKEIEKEILNLKTELQARINDLMGEKIIIDFTD